MPNLTPVFTRGMAVILLVTFIWALGDSAFEFAYPTYLQEAEIPIWIIGIIISISGITGLLVDIPTGSITKVASIKKILILALLAQSFAALSVFLITDSLMLAAIIGVWGAMFSIFFIARDVYYAINTNKKNRSQQYRILNSTEIMAFTIGPMIGGIILGALGYLPISVLYLVMTAIAAGIIFVWVREGKKMPLQKSLEFVVKRRKIVVGAIRNFSKYGYNGIALMFFSFMINVFYSLMLILVPLFYASEGNLTAEEGGVLVGAFTAPFIIFSYLFGRLADHFGKRRFVAIGFLISFIGLSMFSYSEGLVNLSIFAFLSSVGMAMTVPAVGGMIINMVGKKDAGEAVGIWDFTGDMSWTVSPLLVGLFGELFGVQKSFMIFGIMILISIALLVKVKVRH